MRRYLFGWLLSIIFVLPALTHADNPIAIEIRDCPFRHNAGAGIECGLLTVPENYAQPDGAKVYLPYIIFRSVNPNPRPDPIILLVGGPGGAGTSYPSYTFNNHYQYFLQDRDFILYDQRGTGEAFPLLDCPKLIPLGYDLLGNPYTDEERRQQGIDALLECQRDLLDEDIDLAQYTTRTSAADLEALRIALGYEQWNLLGVSYGSKLALTAMRDYPAGIRSVILDSNLPLQSHLWYDLAFTEKRAFDLLFADCAATSTCNSNYPDLENRFYAAVDQLNQEPVTLSMDGYTFYLDGDFLVDSVFQMLYRVADIQNAPRAIHQIADGNYDALRPMVESYLGSPIGLSEGSYYSIQCQEEALFTSLEETSTQADQLPPALRAGYLAIVLDVYRLCEQFAIQQADPLENLAVSSDIPALILSGQYDPITPPRNGQQVAETLSHSYVYELKGIGHGVVRSSVCGLTLAMSFLDDPSQEPDASCLDDLTAPNFR